MKLLGPLVGAHAEALAGNAGKRRSAGERAAAVALVGPVGAVSRAYKGVAVVAFADGSTSEKMLTDLASVARAQAAAAQFNSLAVSVQLADDTPSGEGPGPAQNGAGIVSQLERLAALHSSGSLDDEEFRAAKARIIGG
jgi:Short C-terminal domain